MNDVAKSESGLETESRLKAGHAYALLAITVLLWSIGVVIVRAVHEEMPPIGLSFWRWIMAAATLIPFVLPVVIKNWAVTRAHLGYFAMQGFFMVGGGVLLFIALNFTTAINVSLVNSTQPVLTALAAWIFLRDRIHRVQLLGIVAALTGVTVMVTRADYLVLLNLDFNIGDVITIVATVFYSMYAINLRKMPPELGLFPALFIILILGTMMLFPLYMFETFTIRPVVFSGKLVLIVFVLAVVVSVASLAFWNLGNRTVGHNRAAVFVNLMPVYGAILAIIFLGEELFAYHIAGAILVCTGIFMVVWANDKGYR